MFLTVVHFLHLLTGVIWAGGTMALAWGFYPVLATQGAEQAKPIHDRAAKALGPLMGASGGLLMILGLVRAWAGGGVTRFADAFSAYGLLVWLAFFLMLGIGIYGGRFRARFDRLLADPAAFAAEAPAIARSSALIETVAVVVLVAIMVMLGLGLY